ncbi:MAG: AgmX/PglI C-terminal domain-containing protein [Calditrichaeota bacterium]|nr:AgmX/PglI C-terminal domain-containing protein [Calditrichota bacterium]
MAQVMVFPSDLKRHFFRDTDWSLLIIWAATFLMINSTVFYMQTLPLHIPTASEIADYRKAIFRFKVETIRESTFVRDDAKGNVNRKVVDIQDDKQIKVKDKNLTVDEKRIIREKNRADRAALTAERNRQIARGIAIPTGPTVKNNGATRSDASKMTAVGMMENRAVKIDLKNTLAIATDVKTANRVKIARAGEMVSGNIGDISLKELDGFLNNKGNLSKVLGESSLEMPDRVFLSKGNKKTSNSRKEAISNVVNAHKEQVQYCYWTFKRKDPNLKGQVTIKFTINPTGIVTRVWFENSRWGGNPYRKDVQKAIKNVIMQWRFEETDLQEGDVTAGATFIFE